MSLEDTVASHCEDILRDAARHSLKAVELANTLRARVGQEALVTVRERCDGMLSLLERYPAVFLVERIPKSDCVTLRSPELKQLRPVNGALSSSGSRTLALARPPPQPLLPSGNISPHSISPPPGTVTDMNGYATATQSSPLTPSVGFVKVNQTSNCLHIGNVPIAMSDEELRKVFEVFGPVDCLNVVNHLNRKFAFVAYHSVDHAVTAKHRLSRMHPWKSAISFAKRDGTKLFGRSVERNSSEPIIPPASAIPGDGYGRERHHSAPRIARTPTLERDVYVSTPTQMTGMNDMGALSGGMYDFRYPPLSSNEMRGLGLGMAQDMKQPTFARPSAVANQLGSMNVEQSNTMPFHFTSDVSHSACKIAEPALYFEHSQVLQYENPSSEYQTSHGAGGVGDDGRQSFQSSHGGGGMGDDARPSFQSSHGGGGMGDDRRQSFQSSHGGGFGEGVGGSQNDVEYQKMSTSTQMSTGTTLSHQPLRLSHSQPLRHLDTGVDFAHSNSDAPHFDERILQRLCDDTYVPTQRWLTNRELDAPFCSAIATQLVQLGGEATVSKLRGSLRNRIAAQTNIKSVALKALLEAYPEYFTLQSNHVTLSLLYQENVEPL